MRWQTAWIALLLFLGPVSYVGATTIELSDGADAEATTIVPGKVDAAGRPTIVGMDGP